MRLREANNVIVNPKAVASILIFYVVMYLATLTTQILSSNIFVNVILGMVQLIVSIVINACFLKVGFVISMVLYFLQLGLFGYDLFYQGRETAVFLIAVGITSIILSILIQYFIDILLARISRVKKLYNQTRTKYIQMADKNNQPITNEPEQAGNMPTGKHLITKHVPNNEDQVTETINSRNLDPLTTLPNRYRIVEQLDSWIDDVVSMSQSHGGVCENNNLNIYVAYITITNFDTLLHRLGHQKLDLYIQIVAHKLREAAFPFDMIGRVENCEFLIIIKRPISIQDLRLYCEMLFNVIKTSISSSSDIAITELNSAIGVSCFPNDALFSGDLITAAEQALLTGARSVNGTRDTFTLFSEIDTKNARLTSKRPQSLSGALEKEMIEAINNGDIFTVYQPQYRNDGTLIGFETLLRWNHSEYGLLSAQDFLSVAIKTGQIYKLGEISISSALRTLNDINKINPNLHITINISASELKFGNVAELVSKLIDTYKISPTNINLDIPEECLTSSFEIVKSTIIYLSSLGINMALDNFGRGYSSLSNIPLLPVRVIKFDSFFTDEICTSKDYSLITRSLISLLHEIDIKVCATGISDEQQLTLLNSYDCDFLQGSFLCNPLQADELQQFIENSTS